MIWLLPGVLCLFVLLAILTDRWLEKDRKTVAHCDGETWGTGEDEGLATPCQKPLSAKEVHRVARITQIDEDGIRGHSASLGMFCRDHCPGDCTNPHCRLTHV